MKRNSKIILIIVSFLLCIYALIFIVLLLINKGDIKKDINIIPKNNIVDTDKNTVNQNIINGAELNKSFSSLFSPKFGNPDSEISVIMFMDFDCPFCGQEYESLKRAMIKYKDYGYFEFRNMPLDTLHPNSRLIANSVMCANSQNKFWEMFDELFINYDSRQNIEDEVEFLKTIYNYGKNIGLNMDDFSKCYDENRFEKIINKDFIDGVNYGVNSTPTFFINGNMVSGAITYENWEKLFKLSIEKNR